jgi:hypothetical protein
VRPLERIPLVGAIAIFSVILVLGIYLDLRVHLPWALYLLVVVDVALAALYLRDYAARPLEIPPSPARPAPAAPASAAVAGPASGPPAPEPPIDDSGEFADPVIEADRIASGEVLPEVGEDEDAAEPPVGP